MLSRHFTGFGSRAPADNVSGHQLFERILQIRPKPVKQAVVALGRRTYAAPNPAPLLGIYIGWRGASVKVGKDLSYWSRTNATQRVAGPHLDEALFQIIRAVKTPRSGSTSNLIMIGHSFGGRALERAMTQ